MDTTAQENQIDSAKDCSTLSDIETKVLATITTSQQALEKQIAKFTLLISDSTPPGFIANMIASMKETLGDLTSTLADLVAATERLAAKIEAKRNDLGCNK